MSAARRVPHPPHPPQQALPVLRLALPALRPALLLALAVFGAAAACGGEDGQDAAALAALDAPGIVAQAAAATAAEERFRFRLEHEHGATEIVRGIEMDRATGAVDGAERMQAEVGGSLLGQRFEFGIVILPGEAWLQNPLTRRWEPEDLSLDSLFDPRAGVVAAVEGAIDPRITARERVDGVDTYRVEAGAPAAALGFFSADVTTDAVIPAVAWVGVDDGLVRRLELRGPLTAREDARIVRRLTLSDWGGDVEILPPR